MTDNAEQAAEATNPPARSADRVMRGVAAASIGLALLTFVAAQFVSPLPVTGGGRALPRVPRPPATLGDTLRILGIGSLAWYAAFLSAPLFVWSARRFPLDRRGRVTSIAAHVVLVALLTVVTSWGQYEITYRDPSFAPALGGYVRVGLITGMLPFLAVGAVVHAVVAIARAHERELEAQRMRAQLAESRLEALTAQLQPHFLFNTLQGISTLISRDPAAADAMLTSLGDLLREVLRRGQRREVELQEELAVLQPYLDISRRRFGERVAFKIDAPDSLGHAFVPFFVLQPLVENALRHGIEARSGKGIVSVEVRRNGGSLILTVTDDGVGANGTENGRGVGLTNTEARLRELYGVDQSLAIDRPPDGGYRVRITIPYHERVTPSA